MRPCWFVEVLGVYSLTLTVAPLAIKSRSKVKEYAPTRRGQVPSRMGSPACTQARRAASRMSCEVRRV